MLKSVEYGDGFGSKECKSPSWKKDSGYAKQRKYPTKELNGFIYVWIHADPTV